MFPFDPGLPLLGNIRKLFIDVIQMSLLLTLNKIHILFWCLHCWLSTSKCRSARVEKNPKKQVSSKITWNTCELSPHIFKDFSFLKTDLFLFAEKLKILDSYSGNFQKVEYFYMKSIFIHENNIYLKNKFCIRFFALKLAFCIIYVLIRYLVSFDIY